MTPQSITHNCDCLDFMRGLPDKHFDLAVVDPPYQLGGNSVSKSRHSGGGTLKNRVLNQSAGKFEKWDIAPPKEYFNELLRISRNQVIWGGNYFDLPPTRCFVCWDKVQPWENFSQVEYAWTSFSYPAKIFRFDNRTGYKIHPTQKPIELYVFILNTFAHQGDSIFDSHLGSGSSRIAAYKLGFDFTGCEIDKDYYDKQEERFNREALYTTTLPNGRIETQTTLFQ